MTQNTIRPNGLLILTLVRNGIKTYDIMVNKTGIGRGQLFWYINNLKEEGLLTAEPGTQGTLQLTEAGREAIRLMALTWERGKPFIGVGRKITRQMEELPFTDEPEAA